MPLPSTLPPLPFDWRFFVFGSSGKCFPACLAMCSRYWRYYDPTLDIPESLEDFEASLGDSYYSSNGLSTERLKRALKRTEIHDLDGERINVGLTIEITCPKSLEELYPFFLEDPPIPIILSFDKAYTERNKSEDSHAVLVQSIDFKKEKIYVIDPIKEDLRAPFPYDFERFRLGWEVCENLAFLVAPLNKLILISGDEVKVIKQTTLQRFE